MTDASLGSVIRAHTALVLSCRKELTGRTSLRGCRIKTKKLDCGGFGLSEAKVRAFETG